MDQANTSTPSARETAADRFRYGWRWVSHTEADGRVNWEQVPLTLQDVLHPQPEDTIPQNSVHDRDWTYLGDVLSGRYRDVPGVEVFRDLIIYWDDPELGHHSPDLSVVFDVRERRPVWSSFHVAEEGTRPRLIIEIVSPSTRVLDVRTKVEHYHQARVPYYVIVDREDEEGPPRLLGRRWTPEGWVDLTLDEQGRLPLEEFGLLLGTRDNRVVASDAHTEQELGDYAQVTRDLEAAEEAVRVEAQARQSAEQRALAAEEAVRVEVQARADLERRLRDLEAELRRLNPPGPGA